MPRTKSPNGSLKVVSKIDFKTAILGNTSIAPFLRALSEGAIPDLRDYSQDTVYAAIAAIALHAAKEGLADRSSMLRVAFDCQNRLSEMRSKDDVMGTGKVLRKIEVYDPDRIGPQAKPQTG